MLHALDSELSPPGTELVDLMEAAARLGITYDGVRRRLRRGRLHGIKRDGRWLVALPIAPPDITGPSPDPNPQTIEQAPDSAGHAPDLATQLAIVTADRDWLRARIEELTTLLNRQQEIMLRSGVSHRPLIDHTSETPARSAPDTTGQTPDGAGPAPEIPDTRPPLSSAPPTRQPRPQPHPGFWRRAFEALRGP